MAFDGATVARPGRRCSRRRARSRPRASSQQWAGARPRTRSPAYGAEAPNEELERTAPSHPRRRALLGGVGEPEERRPRRKKWQRGGGGRACRSRTTTRRPGRAKPTPRAAGDGDAQGPSMPRLNTSARLQTSLRLPSRTRGQRERLRELLDAEDEDRTAVQSRVEADVERAAVISRQTRPDSNGDADVHDANASPRLFVSDARAVVAPTRAHARPRRRALARRCAAAAAHQRARAGDAAAATDSSATWLAVDAEAN